MKKIITCIFLIGFVMTGFAQSDKMKEKATEKVEELNAEIVSGDKSLALTEEQRKKIYDVHLERMMAVKKANKDGADKDERKEINKKYFQQIYQEILTKEQKKARRKGKD